MALSGQQKRKYDSLRTRLKELQGLVLAFSGGVDSALLLHVAHEILVNNLFAVTFITPCFPKSERAEVIRLAESLGAKYQLLETAIPDVLKTNPLDRCYLCKKELFSQLFGIAAEKNYQYVIDGSNLDDLEEHRPGFKAIKELGVRSPLLEAGLTKLDIRDISRELHIPVWNKASATCLLTRLPHGTIVDETELERIDKGEDFLKSLGFSAVRLRSHGNLARIELPAELLASCTSHENRLQIKNGLQALGYRYVSLDLAGYQLGSFNEPEDMNAKV